MATPVFINELHYDNDGTDAGEFIEIAGPAGTDLSGWSLVLYNGNGGAPYQTESLEGTIPDLGNGFGTLVFPFPSNGIQNGDPDGIALVDNGINLVQFLSYEGIFTAVGGPADGLTSSDIGVSEDSATPVGASLQLTGTGSVYEDFTWSGPSSSTSGAINTSQAFLTAPAAAITPISSIQGSGDSSPLVGQTVTIEAIVVGDFQDSDADTGRNLRGFYLQEEDDDSDGNLLTSEGLFVFEGSNLITDVNLGDRVRISGTVDEFFGETQLEAITGITVLSSGNPLPTAAPISLPTAEVSLSQDGRFQPDLEAFEGMRVRFTETLTISELFQLDRFNEIRLVQGERPRQFTQISSPDAVAYEAYLQQVGARTIIYDDGLSVQNAAIGNLDGFGPVFDTANAPRMGDTIAALEGVLSYQWAGNSASGATWRVRSAADGTNTFEGGNPRPATPPEVGGSLKVASFNMLNFFATLDGGAAATAIGADPRGADSPTEFERQTAKLVQAILGLDADIIGLVEIENDFLDGASSNAIARLVDELNAATSPGRFAWVDPGSRFVGDDAIAVGFLYDTEAVSLKGGAAILDTPGFLDPNNTGESRNRAALAQTFEEIATGEAFTAVVNHFKSKGASGLGTDPGSSPDVDQRDGQGYWNDTRTKAAQALAAWLDTDPTDSGDADILILGDLNAYAREDPITYLESIGYTDLARLYGGQDSDSYVFDGQTGSLDYILASPSLIAQAQISGAGVWSINADEADALDYNLDFGRDPASFDGTVPYRSSDHDPLLVGLSLAGAPAVTDTLPNGVASGDVDQDSVVLWARSTSLGEISFTYSTDPGFTTNVGMVMGTVIDPTLPVKVSVSGLEPGTRYSYKAEDAEGGVKVGSFVTAAPVGERTGLRFGVTGDWRGELAPYPAIANADEKELAFFVQLGDTIYADYASPALPASQAITLEEYRTKHAEVYGERLGSNTWADLRASTAVFATIDDHEVINDFAGGQRIGEDPRFLGAFPGDDPSALISDSSLYENGLQAFQEYNPLRDEFYGGTGDERTADERKLYRFTTFGSDAAMFLLDTRSFRDPALAAPDTSNPADIGRFLTESATLNRPFLGDVQLTDLKADLLSAQASGITWKFVMVPEPIQELGIYNVDAFEGYAEERSEILRFIEDNDIDNVVFVAADIHGTVVNNLTYTDPASPLGPRIATDVWEITTGSVAFDPPFGPTVVEVATAAGLLSSPERAFYDTLPIAPDPDDLPDDKDDFLKAAFQRLAIGPAGYDPIGLDDNLGSASGVIGSFDVDATLLRGDWFATHTFGWTQFDIDPTTQDLLVTTYGIPSYDMNSLIDPTLLLSLEPEIMSQFMVSPEQEIFTLELLHIADQEAGAAAIQDAPRLSAVLNALRGQDLGNDSLPDNTLTLSSGDAFIPGLFYDASEAVFGSGGIGDIQIQNELGIQAIAFGNHEFDFGTAALAGLIDGTATGDFSALVGSTLEGLDFTGTSFPYLASNLDFSTDPNLQPLAVAGGDGPKASSITSSVVIEINGEKIGVVGATTPTLDIISSPGDVTINPREFNASPTSVQLDALAAEIQAEVDELLAAHPGLNKVVLLAHMQQLDIERALAARLVNVDIIVGGGSNTRLFDGNDRVRAGDSIQGTYPDFIVNAGGTTTALVNTDGSYKYVGRLVLDFDADGNILPSSYDTDISGAYATDAQGVADLGAEGLIDPEIQAIVDAIEAQILTSEGNVFGISEVFLNGNRAGTDAAGDPDGVRTQETNLGNLTADANLAIARETDPTVVVSIKNGGGIRASIGQVLVPPGGSEAVRLPNEAVVGSNGDPVKPEGGISQNDIQTSLAFNNGLTLLTLSREELVAVLEFGVGAVPGVSGRFPQVSGVRFSYDPDLAPGDRLVNAAIVDETTDTVISELVRDGELVGDPGEPFRIVTLNFLAGGGDGYPFPTGPGSNRVDLYDLDSDGVADGALTGLATFAADGTEQDALAEYLSSFFPADSDPNTPVYGEADQGRLHDERIQNLDLREDTVYGADPITGTTVTRFYNTSSQLHFLTTSDLERNILRDPITGKDWVEEGPAFEVYDGEDSVDVMRFYNPSFGKHLWTVNAEEMQILSADSGWILEGRAFGASPEFISGSADRAVWRFYNAGLFDHLYTTNISEIVALSNSSDWINEGVAFYV